MELRNFGIWLGINGAVEVSDGDNVVKLKELFDIYTYNCEGIL